MVFVAKLYLYVQIMFWMLTFGLDFKKKIQDFKNKNAGFLK
jgi:hypothetical protein